MRHSNTCLSLLTVYSRSHQIRLHLQTPTSPKREQSSPKVRTPPRIIRQKSSPKRKNKEQTTDVFYVTAGNAKTLKSALEDAGYLDKRYRMVKAESGPSLEDAVGHIAVPVTKECLAKFQEESETSEWYSLVVSRGEQVVPFSTAVLGRQQK
jgi:hypothetical protein